MADVRPDEVSAILREQLSNYKSEAELEEVGTVLQVGDGVARIYGLSNAQAGELLELGYSSIDAVEQGCMIEEADIKNQSVGFGGRPDRDGNEP